MFGEKELIKIHLNTRSKISARQISKGILKELLDVDLDADKRIMTEDQKDANILEYIHSLLELHDGADLSDYLHYFQIEECNEIIINVDCIYGIKMDQPLALVIAIQEQGADEFKLKVLHICVDVDLESPSNIILFYDKKEVAIPRSELKDCDRIFILLYSIEIGAMISVSPIGLSIIPTRFDQDKFLMHGAYQLPIYNEVLNKKNGQYMLELDPWSLVHSLSDPSLPEYKIDVVQATFIVRIYPELLMGLYSKSLDFGLINSMFLPSDFPKFSLFNSKYVDKNLENSIDLKSILGDDFDPDEITEVIEAFINNFNSE